MKKEPIMIDVWVVSFINVFDGSHCNNLFANRDEAISIFDEIIDKAIKFVSVKMSDFRVSRNVNRITIYDVEHDRVVISCDVSKHTIPCGIMYM